MYDVVKPIKIAIYVNTAYKTMEQIQAELGCDYLINGGTFDAYGQPCCWLKVDGTVLHRESWSDWGYGWDSGPDIRMDSSVNIAKYRNFITCVSLISPGELSYPKEMGGVRGRTAFGLTADGRVIPFCTRDGTGDAVSPEILRAKMRYLGAASALMLDGGISSRGIFPDGKVPANSKRPWVHNYIAIWTNTPDTITACPYPEPTHNVGRWCIFASRDENRWVQWMLNRHGAALDVDGVFGKLSDAALRIFQRANGLSADGICGAKTREALKR